MASKHLLISIFMIFVYLIPNISHAKVKTKHFSFFAQSEGSILVQMNPDGVYDTIITPTLKVRVEANVKMRKGQRVREHAILLGHCRKTSCREYDTFPVIRSRAGLHTREIRFSEVVSIPTIALSKRSSYAPVASQGIPLNRQAIFNACKNNIGRKTNIFTNLTMIVDASRKKRSFSGQPTKDKYYPDAHLLSATDFIKHAVFELSIKCSAYKPEKHVKPNNVSIKVNRIGDKCPANVEVETTIVYSEDTTSKFRAYHNDRVVAHRSIRTRKAVLGAVTLYVAKSIERYKVDPGLHSFQTIVEYVPDSKSNKFTILIDCPPMKVSSAWLSYEVEDKDTCEKAVSEKITFYANRPGRVGYLIKNKSGEVQQRRGRKVVTISRVGDQYIGSRYGFVDKPMGAIDDIFRLEAVGHPLAYDQKPLRITCLEPLKGKVTLRQYGSPSQCKGEALVAIHTNRSGTLPYELECGVGKSWARSVKAPGANKIGVDKVIFDVKNNERVTCALRSRIGNRLIPLHGTNKLFQCIKSNQINRPGGLTLSPPQSNNQPQTCPTGSTRRNGKCVTIALACPKGWTRFRRASQIPRNWDRRTIEKERSVVYCGRKKTVRVCPKGTTGVWPRCKKIQKKCPRGTKGIWPNCRKVQKNCPRGTTGVWPKCKKIQKRCPRGTTGIWPKCKKVIRKCPRGTKGNWPNCRKIIRKCPRGTVGVWPRCRKVPQACRRGFIRFRGKCIRRPEG